MMSEIVNNNNSITGLLPYQMINEINFQNGYHHALLDECIRVLIAIMYTQNEYYCKCVNIAVDRMTALLSTNPLMYQTFVRGLDDSADMFAIGGTTLYKYASNANPLMRGYGFISTVLGLDENTEVVKNWVMLMQNTDMFDVIEQEPTNASVIESFAKVHWTKLYGSKSVPKMLANYNFTGIDTKHPFGYSAKNTPYFVDYTHAPDGLDANILELFARYSFAYADPRRGIQKEICFKQIDLLMDGKVKVHPITVNAMKISGNGATNKNSYAVNISTTGVMEQMVIFDHVPSVDDVGMIYTNPGGLRRVIIKTYSSEQDIENVYWIFTNKVQESRFRKFSV
jgi:hypothetical protein